MEADFPNSKLPSEQKFDALVLVCLGQEKLSIVLKPELIKEYCSKAERIWLKVRNISKHMRITE